MKAVILGATIPLLLIGCTTDWQTSIDKQQKEQDSRLAAIESRLNENINSTRELIKEQANKLEGVEKQLSDLQAERKKALGINLAGKWTMGGPYKVGQACEIIQSANSLVFVNEGGGRSEGFFQEGSVIATGWDGLVGDITDNASRINWRNGTWWIRARTNQ